MRKGRPRVSESRGREAALVCWGFGSWICYFRRWRNGVCRSFSTTSASRSTQQLTPGESRNQGRGRKECQSYSDNQAHPDLLLVSISRRSGFTSPSGSELKERNRRRGKGELSLSISAELYGDMTKSTIVGNHARNIMRYRGQQIRGFCYNTRTPHGYKK